MKDQWPPRSVSKSSHKCNLHWLKTTVCARIDLFKVNCEIIDPPPLSQRALSSQMQPRRPVQSCCHIHTCHFKPMGFLLEVNRHPKDFKRKLPMPVQSCHNHTCHLYCQLKAFLLPTNRLSIESYTHSNIASQLFQLQANWISKPVQSCLSHS